MTVKLNAVPMDVTDICCVQLSERCKKCVTVKGQYFEVN